MSQQVTRYEEWIENPGKGSFGGKMFEDTCGDWVRYTDYAAIEAVAQALNDAWEKAIEDAWSDPDILAADTFQEFMQDIRGHLFIAPPRTETPPPTTSDAPNGEEITPTLSVKWDKNPVPAGVEDLLWTVPNIDCGIYTVKKHNTAVAEAYRRGERDAANELCVPVRAEEERNRYYGFSRNNVDALLAARKAKFFAPKEKTPEERVAIEAVLGKGYVEVHLDGERVIALSPQHAKRYRVGLIAELRAQQEGNRK